MMFKKALREICEHRVTVGSLLPRATPTHCVAVHIVMSTMARAAQI